MEIQRTIGFSRGIRLDPDALTRMSMILIPLATCLYIPCTWRFFDGGKAGIAETLVEILSNLQESVDRTRDLAGSAPITILTPPLLEQDSEFRTARLRWKGPTRFPDTVVRGANDRELLLEVLIWLQDRWLKSGDYDRQMDRFISDAHTHATAALGSRTPVPGSYDARRWLANFTGIPDVRNKAAFNRVRLYLAAALRQPDLPDDLKSRIRTCFPESVLASL